MYRLVVHRRGLVEATQHAEHDVRGNALTFRARIAGTLIKGLRDTTGEVRVASAVALSHLGSRDAIPHLIDRLEEGEASVRMEAASRSSRADFDAGRAGIESMPRLRPS